MNKKVNTVAITEHFVKNFIMREAGLTVFDKERDRKNQSTFESNIFRSGDNGFVWVSTDNGQITVQAGTPAFYNVPEECQSSGWKKANQNAINAVKQQLKKANIARVNFYHRFVTID